MNGNGNTRCDVDGNIRYDVDGNIKCDGDGGGEDLGLHTMHLLDRILHPEWIDSNGSVRVRVSIRVRVRRSLRVSQ